MYNFTKYPLSLVVISLLIISCDPRFTVDFSIENSSTFDIEIIHGDWDLNSEKKDTSIISENTKLIFTKFSSLGAKTEDFLDDLNTVPEIQITTTTGKKINKDITDIENWRKNYPPDKGGTGEVMLQVHKEDFD